MNELQIFADDIQMMSARELHARLEVSTRFNDWFHRMCDYGFEENKDFNLLKNEQVQIEGNREVKRELLDYAITIEMAKEICMIQRSPKGKEVRQYLIQLERAWNTPELVMARGLQASQKLLAEREEKIKLLEADNSRMKPKEIFADAVATSHTSILVGELAKIIKQNGVDIGQARLFEWLRNNGYLIKRKGVDWNMPTQKSMDLGLFEIKEGSIQNADGSVRITKTSKVTGKGQQYFINKFLSGTTC